MTPTAILATAVLAGRCASISILADSEQDCRDRLAELGCEHEPKWCDMDGWRWFGGSVYLDGAQITVRTEMQQIEVPE